MRELTSCEYRLLTDTTIRSYTTPQYMEDIDLKNRISRIKGQVNGIEKMLDTSRDCLDIIQQIVAVNSALKQVGIEILKDETITCTNDKGKLEKLLNSLFKLS